MRILAFLFISFLVLQHVSSQVNEQDSLALVALYESTDGDNWTNNENWLQGPVTSWYGVSVYADRVRLLALEQNNLSGPLPEELGNLTSLVELRLYSNALAGHIPDLGQLSLLSFLFLGDNQLTGPIPYTLGYLNSLWYLDLSENSLSGEIPSTIWQLNQLRGLALVENNLSGQLSPDIDNLGYLEYLFLSDNELSGAIPATLGELSNLWGLEIANNEFTGQIPVELGQLSDLKFLRLDGNRLTGSLPAELSLLKELLLFAVFDNLLTGAVPESYASMGDLFSFYIQNNPFLCEPTSGTYVGWVQNLADYNNTGTCDQGKIQARELDSLALVAVYQSLNGHAWTNEDNWLSGPIDTWYGVSLGADYRIESLSLSSNNLMGSLPSEITQLSQLTILDFSGNDLTGAIPVEIANSQALEILNLTLNSLTGSIPEELGQLSHLTDLRLHGNSLTGYIPKELGNLNKLKQLDLGFNQLSGAIPPELGQLLQLSFLDLSSNQLDGPLPAELASLDNLLFALPDNNLSGAVPLSFVNMHNVSLLLAGNPALCEPDDQIYQDWVQREDILVFSDGVLCPRNLETDSLALVALYESTGGDNWTNKTNWRVEGQLVESWYGVTVEEGRVTQLDLSDDGSETFEGNGLIGTLPSDIGNLSALTSLVIYGDNITGSIPSEVGNLVNLMSLVLGFTQLEGAIPASLGQLSSLEELYLAGNQLSGLVPPIFANLTTILDFQIQNNPSLCEPDSQAYIDWTNGLATYENENTCQIAECAIPTNVTLDNVTEQTASFSWTAEPGVTYDYRYAVQGTQNFTEVLDQSISQVTLQGLSTGVDYTFELRTNCGDSQVSSWVTRNFGTVLGQCDAPSNFSIDNVSGTTVDISWSGYQFADDYSIEYRVLGSSAWTTITGIDQTSYSLTGLLGLQTYQIRVISQCGNQVPGRSNVLTAQTGTGPNCGVPTITIGAISGTDVGLSWTSFGTATYELQYRIYGTGMWTTESGLTAASRDFTGSELVALQTYQVRVRTLCPGGGAPTAWSSVMLFTTGGGANCGVPTISVDAISGTDVDLSWTSFGTATYEMQYRIYGSSVWTTESNLLTAGRSFTGTELLGLQTYQVRVRTQCPGGGVPSSWSSVTLFTTGGGTNCMIPVPGVDALGTTTADISWTSSTGATYNLLYREYGTTVWTTQTGVGTASIQLTGLTASTRYQFRVRANCGAGSLTPYSSVLNFTTDGAGGRTLDGQQDKETVTEQLDQQEQITLDIYPNPVITDMLTIRLSKAVDQIEMTMHSMEGRLIIPQLNRMGESQYQINTTGLSNGVYVLNISYDGIREIRRVMIRK